MSISRSPPMYSMSTLIRSLADSLQTPLISLEDGPAPISNSTTSPSLGRTFSRAISIGFAGSFGSTPRSNTPAANSSLIKRRAPAGRGFGLSGVEPRILFTPRQARIFCQLSRSRLNSAKMYEGKSEVYSIRRPFFVRISTLVLSQVTGKPSLF